jgi:hypothetical protein
MIGSLQLISFGVIDHGEVRLLLAFKLEQPG